MKNYKAKSQKLKAVQTIGTLNDLMINQVHNLHEAEKHWQDVVDKNISRAQSPELKNLLKKSSVISRQNLIKLNKELSKQNGVKSKMPNKIALELINETNHVMDKSTDPHVLDAGLIASHQMMHHYKIASYGTAAAHAKVLKQKELANTLLGSLKKEKKMDEKLTKLARKKVNKSAKKSIVL